jgi:hypothetical protein
MQPESTAPAASQPPATSNANNTSNAPPSGELDPNFVEQFLRNADPNDPLVQAALAQLQQQKKGSDGDQNRKRKSDEK